MLEEAKDDTEFAALVASDPAMRCYAIAFARRAQELRGFALGLYVEAVVAGSLGATLSPGGTDDADIAWRPTKKGPAVKIQVRSCRLRDAPRGARGSLAIGVEGDRARLGDVWVFAVHRGNEHRDGWRFLVRRPEQLDKDFGPKRRVAVRKLAPPHEWVELADLPRAVRTASRH
jgi:hypothetical protein